MNPPTMLSAPAARCTLERLSTRDIEPSLRFEAWRERAHQLVELEPPPPGQPLDAELLLLRDGACVFGAMRSSAYATHTVPRRAAQAQDMMVLTLVQAGEVLMDAGQQAPYRGVPGSLGLYDLARPARYRWGTASREAFLALPRAEALAALGRPPRGLSEALERCRLAPALASQLALLAGQALALDAAEHAGLLASAHALALLVLRRVGRGDELGCDGAPEQAMGCHAAALHFMAREAHRPALTAAEIARGAGCSRTRLYEVFSAQGETVMGVLRTLRLQRARDLLEREGRQNVEALAWRCGFADRTSFSKLFKARFGAAPSEWPRRA